MKKKYWKFLLIGCYWTLSAQIDPYPEAGECLICDPVDQSPCINRPIVEFRVSYFYPFSETVRNMIHNGGVDYALTATIPLWSRLNLWGGTDYFSRSGKMIGINQSVNLRLVPITFGLKYIYSFNNYYGIYLGGGGKYYFVKMVNHADSIPKNTYRNGLGGVVELGNLIYFGNHFLIDIFASCSFKTVSGLSHLPPNATPSRVNVGGWNAGGGIGYKF